MSFEGDKKVLLGGLTIIPPLKSSLGQKSLQVVRKSVEMFAWRERRVPVGEQGELCSPAL